MDFDSFMVEAAIYFNVLRLPPLSDVSISQHNATSLDICST